MAAPPVTLDALPALLARDTSVKLAGLDVDGMLRGKLVSKAKFLDVAAAGFGFCSVIFGWDMHDMTYTRELAVSNAANGYRDVVAVPDLASFRRIPWERDVPFFLVSFFDPDSRRPVVACPRGLLRQQLDRLDAAGCRAKAGAEYEFFTFRVPADPAAASPSPAAFLQHNPPIRLPPLTEGMFGYSLTRPVLNKDWYYDVYDSCARFGCDIEGWHTESGPGVYEAALAFADADRMADRASLFKLVVKSVSAAHNVVPCFMAKPRHGLPGNSGHMHLSLVDAASGRNLLARPDAPDAHAPWPDVAALSDLGRHFLAGLLVGLPDIMPMFAPTVNSYKRLVENFWAPVAVSWGLEHRAASIRLIASKPDATRFEIRVPGADANPHFVLAAVLACGWRGVDKKLTIPCPPLTAAADAAEPPQPLPRTLREATTRFMRPGSIARQVFGDAFVDHFGGTREHEARLFDEAVTDWEMKRYMETV